MAINRVLNTNIDCYNKQLAELGIDSKEDHEWFECAIDLSRFLAVRPLVEHNGDINPSMTVLYTSDMDTITIKENYTDILARWTSLINQ